MPYEFARVLVPRYVTPEEVVGRHADYAPWVITADNVEKLENQALDILYEEWLALEPEDRDDFSNFVQWLKEVKSETYDVLDVFSPGTWGPRYITVQPHNAVMKSRAR